MPKEIQCPHCDFNLKVGDSLIGKPVICPKCFGHIIVRTLASPPEKVEEKRLKEKELVA